MDGVMKLAGRKGWLDEALFSRETFERGFLDLGLDPAAVQGIVERYEDAVSILAVPARPPQGMHFKDPDGYAAYVSDIIRTRVESARRRIREILGMQEYRVEKASTQEVRIPLFWLISPPVTGSKTSYKNKTTDKQTSTWSVTVFGTGMGATQSVELTYSSEFRCSNGDCKLIFLPAKIEVHLVGVYEHGRRISGGLRAEMAAVTEDQIINSGVASLPVSDSLQALSEAQLEREQFPLSADTSDETHVYTRTLGSGSEFEFSAGIEVFGLKANPKAKIESKSETELAFQLPAGHDYMLKRTRNGSGIWWSVDQAMLEAD
jgi:hypothetical protein